MRASTYQQSMPVSFLQYFFDKMNNGSDADEAQPDTLEDHRRRIITTRNRQSRQSTTLDLGKKITHLEQQLAESGLIIETLIELLDERVGISREEIKERLMALAKPPAGAKKPPEIKTVPDKEPLPPELPAIKPLKLAPDDEKDRFEPRRKWRDARSRI